MGNGGTCHNDKPGHCVTKGGCQREGGIRGDEEGEKCRKGGKGAGPATMTSRAKGEEVARIDRCDRYGGNVDRRKVVKRGRR